VANLYHDRVNKEIYLRRDSFNWQTDKAFKNGSACRPDCRQNILEQKLGNKTREMGEKGVHRCSMGVLRQKNSCSLNLHLVFLAVLYQKKFKKSSILSLKCL